MKQEDEFVDLDQESVYDQHGRRITEADANAAADAFECEDLEVLEVDLSPRGPSVAVGTGRALAASGRARAARRENRARPTRPHPGTTRI